MIVGIGTDIVEIERIQVLMRRMRRFPEKILTKKEQEIYEALSPARQIEFLVGRFAAKEAYAKANGTGIGKHLSWKDVEVTSNQWGAPLMTVASSKNRIHVSISHAKKYAVAQVVIENG